MVAKWVEKSKGSPFHLNLAEIEDKRLKKKEDRAYKKRLDEDRNALIDGMIGTSKFDPCNAETIHIFDEEPATQLSLSLRRVVKDGKIVKNETNTLHQLMDQAFTDIQKKFPNIQFNHEGREESSLPPLHSKSPVKAKAVPPEKSSVKPLTKKASAVSLESSSMSGSGSMYHSPQLNPGNFDKELDDAFEC